MRLTPDLSSAMSYQTELIVLAILVYSCVTPYTILMSEFDIINKFFVTQPLHRSDVIVGIGDDTAITQPPENHELAISTDTLISGVHFPVSTLPYDIGYKALAVNLSDLAAMGATPAWVTMALTMPDENHEWL